jgi:hypothetical protein
MRLREITKMRTANTGTRSLFESVMAPELIAALNDWQPDGRDAALWAARGEAREPGPEGETPVFVLRFHVGCLAKDGLDNYSLIER